MPFVSPDNRYLALMAGPLKTKGVFRADTLEILDAHSGQTLRNYHLNVPTETATSFSWLPDSQRLLEMDNSSTGTTQKVQVRVWNAFTGQENWKLSLSHNETSWHVRTTSDNQYLLADGPGNVLEIWQTSTDRQVTAIATLGISDRSDSFYYLTNRYNPRFCLKLTLKWTQIQIWKDVCVERGSQGEGGAGDNTAIKRCESVLSLTSIERLCSSAHAYKQVIQQNNHRNNEQNMNQASSDMHDQPAEQPEDDENNNNRPENTTYHRRYPFLLETNVHKDMDNSLLYHEATFGCASPRKKQDLIDEFMTMLKKVKKWDKIGGRGVVRQLQETIREEQSHVAQ